MYITRFTRMLMAPEGEGSGGGGSVSAIAAQLFHEQQRKSSKSGSNTSHTGGGDDVAESDEGDADSDDDSDSDDDAGKEAGGSALFKSIGKLMGDEGDEADEEEEERPRKKKAKRKAEDDTSEDGSGDEEKTEEQEPSEEEKEKAKRKGKPWDGKSPLTDDELINLELTNKDGAPIGAKPAAGFKVLKERLKSVVEELKTLKSPEAQTKFTTEIETLKTQLTEREKKIEELSSQIEDEMFENSPGFKEAFQKPVDNSIASIREYIDLDPKENPEDFKAANTLFVQASRLAYLGKRREYLKVMDELCDTFVEGGQAVKTAFATDAVNFFTAQKALADAVADKSENRKTIVENKMAEARSKSYSTTEAGIKKFIGKFEADNQRYIESLPDKMRDNFKKSYDESNKTVRQALAQFAATGTLPPSLNEIIGKGIAYDAVESKSATGWGAFVDAINKNKILEKEVAELRAKLKKHGREPAMASGGGGGGVSYESSGKRKSSGSAIFDQIKASDDDDEDDDD